MSLPDDFQADPPLRLAPTDPGTDAARQRIRLAERVRQEPIQEDIPPAPWQFTLGQLLVGNTILAVMLAMLQVLAPSLVAGALGLIAFTLVLFVTVYQPDRQSAYPLAWALILVYVLVATIALWRG